MTPDPINCAAGCKRTVKDMDEALAKAWSHLEITGRWRCPACTRELDAVNSKSRNLNEKETNTSTA